MQNRYYIVFKAQINGQVQESCTVLGLDAPIQYDSDLNAVTEHLVKQVGAEGVLLVNWIPLAGPQRPALEPAPSIEEQSRQVAEHILDQAKADVAQQKAGRAKPAAKKATVKAAPKAAKPSSRRK